VRQVHGKDLRRGRSQSCGCLQRQQGHSWNDEVLRIMQKHPALSLSELARRWTTAGEQDQIATVGGAPNKQKVHRVMIELVKERLAQKQQNGRYALTEKGRIKPSAGADGCVPPSAQSRLRTDDADEKGGRC
jgi:hypothetical protein